MKKNLQLLALLFILLGFRSHNAMTNDITAFAPGIIQENWQADDNTIPIANNDYFDGNRQGFVNVLKANVFGGSALWSKETKAGFETRSLSDEPAINNGHDFDVDNHNLAQMQFVLAGSPQILSTYCTASKAGILDWNGDGTFQFTRTDPCVQRVRFTYKIIDPAALESAVASVTIDFPVNNPLTISLSSFNAYRNKTTVVLKWTSFSEQNSRGFYVQRNTGEGWVTRAFVPTSADDGISRSPLNYYFSDFNESRIITQYRLAQADINGGVSYSQVCLAMGEQTGHQLKISAYPNPSSTGTIYLLFANGEKYNLEIFDMHGRRIRQWSGIGGEQLTVRGLEAGMYVIRIREVQTGDSDSLKISVIGR